MKQSEQPRRCRTCNKLLSEADKGSKCRSCRAGLRDGLKMAGEMAIGVVGTIGLAKSPKGQKLVTRAWELVKKAPGVVKHL